MKYDLIVADCPWSFADQLTMSSVKRGAASQYSTMTDQDIINLDVKSLAADNSVLVLWVPGSLLQLGLDVMKSWGFSQKQVEIWGKIVNDPFENLKKDFKKALKTSKDPYKDLEALLGKFDYDRLFSVYMGHIFRQSHELALVGTRGKVSKLRVNKSQKSIILDQNKKHSAKTELLQDKLELIYPKANKLELFGRRLRNNWTVVGNEILTPIPNEDIRDAIERLKKL